MFSESTILVLSGSLDQPETIARMVADHNRVIEADHVEEALERLSTGIDLVVVDLAASKSKGLELLRAGKARQPNKPFLVVAERNDVDVAIEAMKLGASDCLMKPVEREQLLAAVRELVKESAKESQGAAGSEGDSESSSRQGTNIDIPPGTSLEDLERAAVEQALAQHHGNRTHAAKTLGISVRTLQRKLKAWGIPVVGLQHSSPRSSSFGLPAHSGPAGHSAFRAHAH